MRSALSSLSIWPEGVTFIPTRNAARLATRRALLQGAENRTRNLWTKMKKEDRIAKARQIGAERAPEREKARAAEAKTRAERLAELGPEGIRSKARAASG